MILFILRCERNFTLFVKPLKHKIRPRNRSFAKGEAMVSAKRTWGMSIISILCFVGFSYSGFITHKGDAQEVRVRNGSWDREGAAKYLDERMDIWFAKAKKLRTGQAETMCVSCHTTVPYVIARPALRQAMQISAATPQETRLIEETTRRVEYYSTQQPLYDHSDSKKVESRGTEVVLNALILASADAALNRRVLSGPTREALKQLWERQRYDGAWDWLDSGLEPFESVDGSYFGATLAAMTIGMVPVSPQSQSTETGAKIERLRAYLKEKYISQSLFNRAWMLLASARLNGLVTREQREAFFTEIQGLQRNDGGWALNSLGPWRWSKMAAPFQAPGTPDASLLTQSDGYATGLIVYALRQAGIPTSHPAVSKGLDWLKSNQHEVRVDQHAWMAWRAHSLNYDREHGGEKGEPWRRMFMSDSATAFAVLALVASD